MKTEAFTPRQRINAHKFATTCMAGEIHGYGGVGLDLCKKHEKDGEPFDSEIEACFIEIRTRCLALLEAAKKL